MKTMESVTSTGGTLTEFFDANGNRVRAVHSAGKPYSGAMAQIEAREANQKRKVRKSK